MSNATKKTKTRLRGKLGSPRSFVVGTLVMDTFILSTCKNMVGVILNHNRFSNDIWFPNEGVQTISVNDRHIKKIK